MFIFDFKLFQMARFFFVYTFRRKCFFDINAKINKINKVIKFKFKKRKFMFS